MKIFQNTNDKNMIFIIKKGVVTMILIRNDSISKITDSWTLNTFNSLKEVNQIIQISESELIEKITLKLF